MAYPGGPFEERDGYLWPVEPPRCLECDAELDKIKAEGYDPWEGDD